MPCMVFHLHTRHLCLKLQRGGTGTTHTPPLGVCASAFCSCLQENFDPGHFILFFISAYMALAPFTLTTILWGSLGWELVTDSLLPEHTTMWRAFHKVSCSWEAAPHTVPRMFTTLEQSSPLWGLQQYRGCSGWCQVPLGISARPSRSYKGMNEKEERIYSTVLQKRILHYFRQ